MVPHALGQRVEFIKNEGPKLEKFNFKNLSIMTKFFSKITPNLQSN